MAKAPFVHAHDAEPRARRADDDGWTAMCCLEPGVVNVDRPAVDTGGSLVLSQTLTPDLD